jgi:hypothetical protein
VKYGDTVMDIGCGHLKRWEIEEQSGMEFVLEVVRSTDDERSRQYGYV